MMDKNRRNELGLLGSFAHVDCLIRATRAARKERLQVVDIFSPVPVPELVEIVSPQPSPVRFLTFLGGVAGIVGGLALGILTAIIWNIVVGGKPPANHVPFVVVAFEAMILLGALGTFVGLIASARLPFTRFPGPAYKEEFSLDKFGLWIRCEESRASKAIELLEKEGATAVDRLDGDKAGRARR